jgi:hypothetical protein
LFRLQPATAVWLDPSISGWQCSKLTKDHDEPAPQTSGSSNRRRSNEALPSPVAEPGEFSLLLPRWAERVALRREKRVGPTEASAAAATTAALPSAAEPTPPPPPPPAPLQEAAAAAEPRALSPRRRPLRVSATPQCAALGPSGPPRYLAVVARWDEDVAWARETLPLPAVVYEHAKPSSRYNVAVNKVRRRWAARCSHG